VKLNNKGFTLVELLLAIAISTIVLGTLTALTVYASRSTKLTNEKITLQNEVKDAVNHIESYCMEAETASWHTVPATGGGTAKVLVVYERRDDMKSIVTSSAVQVDMVETLESDAYAYWFMNGKLYFGKCSHTGDVKIDALEAKDIYLLADHVKEFSCEVKKNEKSVKQFVEIYLQAGLGRSEYSCNKTVYIRNQ